MVDYPDDSPTRRRGVRKHLALLNWHERPRMVGVTLEQLGLKGPVNAREFWTDEQIPIGPPGLALCLPGHGAKLLEIR